MSRAIQKRVRYGSRYTIFSHRQPHTRIIVLEQKGGLDDGRWFKVADILELNFYEDILPIVTKAVTMLVGRRSR
jgi:hypothetical protein